KRSCGSTQTASNAIAWWQTATRSSSCARFPCYKRRCRRRPHASSMSEADRAPTRRDSPRRATTCASSTSIRSTSSRPACTAPSRPCSAMRVGSMTRTRAPTFLLLGPLYHLTKSAERIQALMEARRVVRPGGLVAVALIHRFASLLDGTRQGFLADPRFVEIVKRDLLEGQHRNPENIEGWFTTAYFHLPHEICEEVEAAGLTVE